MQVLRRIEIVDFLQNEKSHEQGLLPAHIQDSMIVVLILNLKNLRR